MAKYLDKVKSLADNFFAAVRAVPNDDLVFFILGGLPTEFEPLVMIMTSQTTSLFLDKLQSVFLTQEHQL